MYFISSNALTIQVSAKGAELQSIYHRQNEMEYLWSGDSAFWGKKSPVLFPIVGELKDKTYTYKGEKYNLNRHGFARDMEFELTDSAEEYLTFSIKSDSKTLPVYPFPFKFSVKYAVIENIVQVSYIVDNTGDETMYFSVGGHPAFKVPIAEGTSYDDYRLVFNEKETIGRLPLSSHGLIETAAEPFLLDQNIIPLKKELFYNDAIVLDGLKSSSVSIESPKTPYSLKVAFEGFPFLGLWSMKGADFVCIEPWCGIADSVDATGVLEEKKGINALQPGGMFVASYTVQVF